MPLNELHKIYEEPAHASEQGYELKGRYVHEKGKGVLFECNSKVDAEVALSTLKQLKDANDNLFKVARKHCVENKRGADTKRLDWLLDTIAASSSQTAQELFGEIKAAYTRNDIDAAMSQTPETLRPAHASEPQGKVMFSSERDLPKGKPWPEAAHASEPRKTSSRGEQGADVAKMITALREIAEDKIRQGDAIWMRDTARAALSQTKEKE